MCIPAGTQASVHSHKQRTGSKRADTSSLYWPATLTGIVLHHMRSNDLVKHQHIVNTFGARIVGGYRAGAPLDGHPMLPQLPNSRCQSVLSIVTLLHAANVGQVGAALAQRRLQNGVGPNFHHHCILWNVLCSSCELNWVAIAVGLRAAIASNELSRKPGQAHS